MTRYLAAAPGVVAAIWLCLAGAASAAKERVIYSFGTPDVSLSLPVDNLTVLNGALYGLAYFGGYACNGDDVSYCGGVFKVTPDGSMTDLYDFSGTDGASPLYGLTLVGSTLYGTTGGWIPSNGARKTTNPNSHGVVFSILNDNYAVLAYTDRSKKADGIGDPSGGLVQVGGLLYGSAWSYDYLASCNSECGAIYQLTPTGTGLTATYGFQGPPDGNVPQQSPVAIGGVLYGVARQGGSAACDNGVGCGVIYSLTTSGAETVLYTFTGGADGNMPGGLIDGNGTLYGFAYGGGTGTDCGGSTCGVVFSITTDGAFKVLHRFKGGKDGGVPAGLAYQSGVLYGVTTVGGDLSCGSGAGCGTFFSLTTAGKTKVLHAFHGGTKDGVTPSGAPAFLNGVFYGATSNGGATNYGTIYSLTP